MQVLENFNELREEALSAGYSKQPGPGGYVCRIVSCTDEPSKQFLKFEFEIIEGEFAGYSKETIEKHGFCPLTGIVSYKPRASRFFAAFINHVSESNRGFVWNFDEKVLIGKTVGVVFGEREYLKKNGNTGTSLRERAYTTADNIREGNYKMPEKELLKISYNDYMNNDESKFSGVELNDDEGELPF